MMGSVTSKFLSLKFFYLFVHWKNPKNKYSHWSPFSTLKKKERKGRRGYFKKEPVLCLCLIFRPWLYKAKAGQIAYVPQHLKKKKTKTNFMKSVCPTVLQVTEMPDSLSLSCEDEGWWFFKWPHLTPCGQVLHHSPDLEEEPARENKPGQDCGGALSWPLGETPSPWPGQGEMVCVPDASILKGPSWTVKIWTVISWVIQA